MKTRIFLSSLIAALFVFVSSSSYSQDKCCENKSASCCTESKECCNEHASHDMNGNAGGDSTKPSGLTCVVSGEAIEAGGGLTFDYYGTTYNFCCEGCVAKFKKEPLDYIKAGGLTCPVMGDAIESKDVFVMHNGTKYYLCCAGCEGKFKKDPEKYINKKN